MTSTSPIAIPPTGSADDVDPRAVKASPYKALLANSALLVLLIDLLLVAVFTVASKNNVFWSLSNAEALLRNGTEILVLALGVTLLMSAGIFDLSIGANLVLASVLAAVAMRELAAAGLPAPIVMLAGFALALLAGALFGVVNGLIITKLRVNSLIATLGTLGVGSGVAQLLTNGQDVRQLPEQLQSGFALVRVGIVPLPMFCAAVLLVVVWALLRFTRYGLRTLAIGSNEGAASRAGIAVDRHKIALTALAGGFAGFAGFIDIARFASTALASHQLDGLNAVTAVVIGGTALTGGRASVMGSLWGAALSVILLSGLIIIRVQPFWQLVATGVVLIAAVAFDQLRGRELRR